MATGGAPAKKKKDDDEIGKWLAIGVGVAAGAGLAYGAKKMFDYFTSDKEDTKTQSSKEKDLEDFYAGDDSYNSQHASNPSGSSSIGLASSLEQLSFGSDSSQSKNDSLQDDLEEYYQNYANIPQGEMTLATNVVDEIKAEILTYFQTKHPSLGINHMIPTGSSDEGLKVVAPDEFDVMFPIFLDGADWQLTDGMNSTLCAPGFSFIQRIVSADKPRGSDVYDKFLDEEQNYLSPVKFRRACQGFVVKAMNTFTNYQVTCSTHGPAITLHVKYNGNRKFDVDFVPAMVIDGVWVVAKPHYRAQEDSAFDNLWRQSFSADEKTLLMSLPRQNHCHLKVLKIMKAIRLNHHPQFGMFTSYIYKTVLLHMLEDIDDENEWRPECLQERFKDMLLTLKENLQARQLKHYFCPGVNLLDPFSTDSCDNLRNYIANVVGKNRYHKLMGKRDYTG